MYLGRIFFASCVSNLKISDGFYPESLQKVSQSVNGVVSTAHPLATKAGVAMLQKGGNAIDALRQVPGVEVDPDDNISLRGSSKVNLMIDGKPSSIAGGDIKSLLQSVPAANIADIEVMTNPCLLYTSDAADE